MSLTQRLILVVILVGLGLGAHLWLQRHLDAGEAGAFPQLREPLSELPVKLVNEDSPAVTWSGREHPGREAVAKQVPFVDQMLYRAYTSNDERSLAVIYLAHARSGEDRKHHPEICMREGAGAPEDLAARKLVPLADEGRSAQRFCFKIGSGRSLNLYYWHYSFPPVRLAGESSLQSLHRRALTSPPSVSVQVTTQASGADVEALEQSLLPALDRSLRDTILPAGCRVGHERIPITMIRR